MAKKIYTVLKLKDEFTKPLKGATSEEKAFSLKAKEATAKVNSLANKAHSGFSRMKNSAKNLVGAISGIGLAISAAGAVSFGKDSIEAAKAQIEAETKLEAVLGNVKSVASGGALAIKAAKNELVETAGKLQGIGVIGDEVTIAGQQQLATFQLSTNSIKTLSEGMTDLLAQQKGLNATQDDAVGIGNLIGKAMNGQTGALSRVGIIMNDNQKLMMQTGNEEQRAATLAEILKDNVGGVNKALAQTDQGKIQQATNALGDMKEQIGAQLLPHVAKFAGYISDHIPQISAAISKTGTIASKAMNKIGKAISWVKKHSDTLIPVAAGLLGALIAFKVITTVIMIFNVLKTTITAVRTAFLVANAAMLPAMLIPMAIAAAIGALIAIGVAMYKHWDDIKPHLQPVIDIFNSIKDTIKAVIDKVRELGDALENSKIGNAVKGLKSAIMGPGGTMRSNLQNAIEDAKSSGKLKPKKKNALGTHYFSGGLTSINEHGGEIMDLPSGTRIFPHDLSTKMSMSSGTNVNINVNIEGNVIGNEEYANYIGTVITNHIAAAAANS